MRLLFFLLLAGHSLYSYAQDSQFQGLLLDSDLTENAHAVVRLEEMVVHLQALDKMTIRSRRIITVKNKLGNHQVDAYLPYDSSTRIKNLEAVIYDVLGREVDKIKEKDFKDVSAVDGGTLYSDNRVKYLAYTPTQYPYTVEFSYEIFTKNTAFVPTWRFFNTFHQGIEKSSYTVTYDSPELRPVFKELNLQGLDIKREDSPNSTTFVGVNLKPVKEEPYRLPYDEWTPTVQVRMESFNYEEYTGKMTNWNEVGQWMHDNLLSGQDQLPQGTIEEVRSLTKGVEDPIAKARIIYDFVQQNTRYISVQVGIGGIQPISALEVDRLKYGDCKGLSNYAMALLKAVGVPAYYTHVEAGPEKIDFQEDFADLKQGNHVILAIPDGEDYQWIDCTSQVHPFGFLGDFTDDRRVLVMKPGGGELAHTPAYKDDDNYQFTEAEVNIDDLGNLRGEVKIQTRGIQYDNRFRLQDKPQDEKLQYYKEYWGHLNNLSLKSIDHVNDKKEVFFEEKIVLNSENYATSSGDLLLLTPNAFNRNNGIPDRVRNRKLPFRVSRGYLDEDLFRIALPQGYEMEAQPQLSTLDTEFGTYEASLDYDEETHSLVYSRKLLLREGTYSPEKYRDYRAFRKEVSRADGAQLVLKRKKKPNQPNP